MESRTIIRKVNGIERKVDTMSDLVTVEKLDWSKLNPDINEYLHGRLPNRKDDEFYFDDQYSGLIEINNETCLIITKDCVGKHPIIFDYKQGIIGFKMDIYLKSKDPSVEIISPEFNFSLIAPELLKIKTGFKTLLPEFMDGRYKYNPRIESNELKILKYLTENNYKPFDKLKK